jgi:hypothetical protein
MIDLQVDLLPYQRPGGFVDPTTLKPLNFSPGYVERATVYGADGTGAGVCGRWQNPDCVHASHHHVMMAKSGVCHVAA